MIDLEEVLLIHQELIEAYGGSLGVRDMGSLESALKRPFSGFGDTAFYVTPEEKASAILESIVVNHPFVDGNKRTGLALMRVLLIAFDKEVRASQDEKYDFVVAVASGVLDYDAILEWIRNSVIS